MSPKSVILISLIFYVIAMLCICTTAKYRRRASSRSPLRHSIDNRAKSSKMKYMQRVWYGYKIWNEDYPFIIQLIYTEADGTQTLCSGSIITKKCILTAAHCITDKNLYNFEIIIARKKHTVYHYIIPKSSFRPERYNATTNEFDIAILVLHRYIDPDIAKRVAVSIKDYKVKKIRLYGWGLLAPDEPQEHRLRYFVADTRSWKKCRQHTKYFSKNMICTKRMKTRVAGGDSGGPVLDWESGNQVGVTYGVVNYNVEENWKRDGITLITRIGSPAVSSWLTKTVENHCG